MSEKLIKTTIGNLRTLGSDGALEVSRFVMRGTSETRDEAGSVSVAADATTGFLRVDMVFAIAS